MPKASKDRISGESRLMTTCFMCYLCKLKAYLQKENKGKGKKTKLYFMKYP